VGSIVLKSFQTTKQEDFINTFNLNVSGAIHFIRKLQKQLAESNGSIVLFSTVAVDRGFNMHSVISTAKGAIQGLTTSLAAEFAPKIRVNCIAPSITQSKMAKPILDNARIAEQIPLKHAMKRVGKPEDLAETAKGAIQGLTTSLAAEFAPKIRVNCIAPSITQSKMAKPILDNARIAEQIPLKHAMKRVGKPEDLAETAKFLLSSNSSWITGQTIHVDGGKINLET